MILDGSEFQQPLDRPEEGDPHHMLTDTVDSVADNGTHPHAEIPDQDSARAPQDGAPFVERFHLGAAGAPISHLGQSVPGFQALRDDLGPDNIWYPFRSQRDWDFA